MRLLYANDKAHTIHLRPVLSGSLPGPRLTIPCCSSLHTARPLAGLREKSGIGFRIKYIPMIPDTRNTAPETGFIRIMLPDKDEFATMFADIQARFDELAKENHDMVNLLAGTGTGTLFVDKKLRILRYSTAAGVILNLVPDDTGRPAGAAVSTLVGYNSLAADITAVIDTLKPMDIEVQTTEGRWYTMHIMPRLTRRKVREGAMISFQEITKHKREEEEIRMKLEEKETLLKEVHHRIKNNIVSIESLLLLHVDSVTSHEALSALQDALGRVKSMRVLYDLLLMSEGYKSISVRKYTETLLDSLAELFQNGIQVTITRNIAEFRLEPKDLFHLGIIINELLTNVMKYGFAGRKSGLIHVTLKKSGRHITFTVQDNGVGFPEGFELKKKSGYGLMLVQMLSKQLGGSLRMENLNGAKTVLTFDAGMLTGKRLVPRKTLQL
jgi:two-component sensor histidine kinase